MAPTPELLTQFLLPLSEAGVDIFHASQRRFWEPEFEGSDLNLAGWTKEITGKPSISVGSVGLNVDFLEGTLSATPMDSIGQRGIDELLARMEKGEFDLIGVGRALLQDPEWVVKVEQGRFDELADFDRASIGKLY